MTTAATINAEHIAQAANDNFAFAIGQRVEDASGVMSAIVMARFTSSAGRLLYDVIDVSDRRLRTILEPGLRAA